MRRLFTKTHSTCIYGLPITLVTHSPHLFCGSSLPTMDPCCPSSAWCLLSVVRRGEPGGYVKDGWRDEGAERGTVRLYGVVE